MSIKHLVIAASIVTITALTACSKNENSNNKTSTSNVVTLQEENTWPVFIASFLEDYFEINPTTAVYQGKHEFDGQLPNWSQAGLKAMVAFRKKIITEANAIDETKLTDIEKFERTYLIHVMEGELFWLEEAELPYRNPAFYVQALDPSVYIARPYADATTRMKAFIAYANNVPLAAEQIKQNLQLPLTASFVKYSQAGFGGFAEYYTGDAKTAFAAVTDQALQKEFDIAVNKAAIAMNELVDFVNSQPATVDGFALGAEKFSNMLKKNEAVDISLTELEAIGKADLQRNQINLKNVCSSYAPDLSLENCMKKMAANKSPDGPVAEARRQLPGLKQFIIDSDLVSIPGDEEAQVQESPPYNRQNSAYIDIPGPYEKGLPSVYYISPPDPSWSQATQDNFVPGKMNLLGTSVHEIWPGHFLNFLHAKRSDSLFGRLFVGYAFAEGWAHYAEELMIEAGLHDGDAETQIGQISNALLRNCRFLSAIGLHAKGMTMAESKQLFINECYQDEGSANQQSARGTYDPAYLNYTMGKLMIKKLREDWTQGDRTKWKAFHDQFLIYGGPPIPLVRQAMMHEADAKAVF